MSRLIQQRNEELLGPPVPRNLRSVRMVGSSHFKRLWIYAANRQRALIPDATGQLHSVERFTPTEYRDRRFWLGGYITSPDFSGALSGATCASHEADHFSIMRYQRRDLSVMMLGGNETMPKFGDPEIELSELATDILDYARCRGPATNRAFYSRARRRVRQLTAGARGWERRLLIG